jgi:phosphoribosylformylglycinamidine synthase subunit PurL
LREIEGLEAGAPPPVDLAAEKRHGDFVRHLIEQGRADCVHDCSDGGVLVALAEMAMAGAIGMTLTAPDADIPFWFGEDQARYVLAVPPAEAERMAEDAARAGIPIRRLGSTGGAELTLGGRAVALSALRSAHESWFPEYMAAGVA